jgi:methyl-accepting chemotaxis protein
VLKHLKIGIRLGLGFGAVLLLLLAVALLAMNRMAAMHAATAYITADAYPKVVVAKDLIRDTVDLPRQMRGMLLTTDEAQNEHYRKVIDQLRADTNARIGDLTKLVASESGKKLLKRIADRHAALEPTYAQFLVLVRSDRQHAADYVNKDYMPLNRELIDAVDDLAKHQSDKMQE